MRYSATCALAQSPIVANVQAIGSVGHHELTDRRGRFEAEVVTKIRIALRWVFDL